VQAVVDGYGPTDFSLIDAQRDKFIPASTEIEGIVIPDLLPSAHPDSFESRFLGTPVTSSSREVQFANPITYIREGAPPFLIVHGLSDALMPWQQSLLLFEALQAAGNDVAMLVLERMGHGFFNNSKLDYIDPGLITFYNSPTSRVFQNGRSIEQFGFGFDPVEEFFRFHLSDTVSNK
jgi:acetyl esterase/lipase